ncbi:hypothetical protein HPB50_028117 [Hyalomma asiaticum]|nr:hypothetical protein HPB50_028117 [Hyalomma asiaticum]
MKTMKTTCNLSTSSSANTVACSNGSSHVNMRQEQQILYLRGNTSSLTISEEAEEEGMHRRNVDHWMACDSAVHQLQLKQLSPGFHIDEAREHGAVRPAFSGGPTNAQHCLGYGGKVSSQPRSLFVASAWPLPAGSLRCRKVESGKRRHCLAVALVFGQGPAVCDGHLETTRGDGDASVSWLPAAWSSTPPVNRCFFKETTPPSMIISAWNYHGVTSVPVTTLGLLNLHPLPSHDSGHGSSGQGTMLRNPFCFAIQVKTALSASWSVNVDNGSECGEYSTDHLLCPTLLLLLLLLEESMPHQRHLQGGNYDKATPILEIQSNVKQCGTSNGNVN